MTSIHDRTLTNPKKLQLTIVSGRNLIAADSNGKSDPYAILKLGSHWKTKTKTIKKTLNPHWNQTFMIDLREPEKLTLEIEVFDEDRFGKDDTLGVASFALKDLPKGKEVTEWIGLRGVPNGEVQFVFKAVDFGKEDPAQAPVPQQQQQTAPQVSQAPPPAQQEVTPSMYPDLQGIALQTPIQPKPTPVQHQPTQPAQPAPVQPAQGLTGKTVVALYPFKAKGAVFSSGDKDIDLNANELMLVIADFGNGWVKVDKSGIVGLVPASYVKPHVAAPTPVAVHTPVTPVTPVQHTPVVVQTPPPQTQPVQPPPQVIEPTPQYTAQPTDSYNQVTQEPSSVPPSNTYQDNTAPAYQESSQAPAYQDQSQSPSSGYQDPTQSNTYQDTQPTNQYPPQQSTTYQDQPTQPRPVSPQPHNQYPPQNTSQQTYPPQSTPQTYPPQSNPTQYPPPQNSTYPPQNQTYPQSQYPPQQYSPVGSPSPYPKQQTYPPPHPASTTYPPPAQNTYPPTNQPSTQYPVPPNQPYGQTYPPTPNNNVWGQQGYPPQQQQYPPQQGQAYPYPNQNQQYPPQQGYPNPGQRWY